MRNREIIYWKWDKTYLEEGVLEKELALFNRRCPFDTVYLKYQYTGLAYNDPKLKELLLKATKSLSEYGKQILLDIDPRGENVNFLKKYPGKELYTMRFAEGELDENGYGEIAIESEHLGEIERSEEIKGAWLFEKTNVKCFRSNSLTKVECEKKGKMISIFAGKVNSLSK